MREKKTNGSDAEVAEKVKRFNTEVTEERRRTQREGKLNKVTIVWGI
jgi:hypothetical protein